MAKDSSAPQFVKYVGPVLDALQRLGGSGRPDEVRTLIAEELNLSEQEQSEPLPSKAQPRFDNQVHWARFYLSKGGYIDSSKRGVWALTEKGRSVLPLSEAQARGIFREVAATFSKAKGAKPSADKTASPDDVVPPANEESAGQLSKEAVRDGVPPIELVDGEKLIGMLEQLELGLKPQTTYTLDPGFFESFD